MNNLIKKGVSGSVILLFIGLAFAPNIQAKNQQEARDEISTIIEENVVIRNYIEKNSDEDCGCNKWSSTLDWYFPILCLFLIYPLIGIVSFISMVFNDMIFNNLLIILYAIAVTLNCP